MPWKIVTKGKTLRHNGVDYEEGDTIPDECVEVMSKHVEQVGESKKKSTKKTEESTPAQTQEDDQEAVTMTEEELMAYVEDKGGGSYLLPDGETVKGKRSAIKRTKELLSVDKVTKGE